MIGPYKIKKLVGSSYQLDLLVSMKIYNVFYSSLFRKTAENSLFSQYNNSIPQVIVNNKKEWKVDDILDARKKNGRKIRKKNYRNMSSEKDTTKIVEDFYSRNPTKPCQN